MNASTKDAQKVLVVGAGIVGLSTAWALARRGAQVEVIDQGPIPNTISSSFDEHRINRHAYGKLTGYSRMMPDAYRIWNGLWADIGAVHYQEIGGVYVLRQANDPWYDLTRTAMADMGIGFRDMPADEIARRLPMLEPSGIQKAVWVDGSGLLFPTRILNDMIVHLARIGVRFHACTQVSDVDPEQGRITTNRGVLSGDQVVIAAGAWIDRLVPAFKGHTVASRQAVVFLSAPAQYQTAWAEAPVLVVRDGDYGLYALPAYGSARLKIGDHRFSRIGNPDDSRTATAQDMAPIWDALRQAYRDIGHYDVLEEKACFYTVTEDEAFRAEPLGARAWAVSACSGHGFKLAPLVGTGVALGVLGQAPAAEISAWIAGRGQAPSLPLV